MKSLRKSIFVVLIVTLAVFINQSYSLPNASESEIDASEAAIDEVEVARIVKRGLFDCPHNCWGNVGKLNYIKKSF